jgi:hypothetical protein
LPPEKADTSRASKREIAIYRRDAEAQRKINFLFIDIAWIPSARIYTYVLSDKVFLCASAVKSVEMHVHGCFAHWVIFKFTVPVILLPSINIPDKH